MQQAAPGLMRLGEALVVGAACRQPFPKMMAQFITGCVGTEPDIAQQMRIQMTKRTACALAGGPLCQYNCHLNRNTCKGREVVGGIQIREVGPKGCLYHGQILLNCIDTKLLHAVIVLLQIDLPKVDKNIVMNTIQALYDAQTAKAKYQAVAGAIRQAIANGVLSENEKLPPVRELAWSLQITPGTVARAYTVLTDDGTVFAEVGRGTFVAPLVLGDAPSLNKKKTREYARQDTDIVSLYSPKLPNLGQADLIHDSFATMAKRPDSEFLAYPGRDAALGAQRAALRWLSSMELGAVNERDLVLSHGAQNGVLMIMQAILSGAAPVVLVEELSYPGFRRAAQLLRAIVVPVPMDQHGIVPEALEELTKKHGAQILCTCPSVHNPTVRITSDQRRRDIAAVAKRTGLHVIEDESYRLSVSDAPTYRSLLPDQGWFVTSISKSFSPSLRVGFVVAPKAHRDALRRTGERGFFGLAVPLIHAAEDILSRPETYEMMDAIRLEMRKYIHAGVNALGGYDITWHPDVPYIWLSLPEGWRASAFAQAAEAQGAQLRTAEDYVPRNGFAPHAVRLAVNASVSLNSFENALERIRALLDNPPESLAG